MNKNDFRFLVCLVSFWGGVFAALLVGVLQRLA